MFTLELGVILISFCCYIFLYAKYDFEMFYVVDHLRNLPLNA